MSAFIDDVARGIEEGGLSAGNIADIAKEHGLYEYGTFISVPGYPKLFFLWNIKPEAAREFIKLLNERDDFTAIVYPMSFIFGGSIPTMPMAKRIYNYKREHWIPIYFTKKEVKRSNGRQ